MLKRLVWNLWNTRSIASAAAQTLVVNLGALIGNIGTGVILARALGPEGRGWMAAVLLAPSLAASLMSLGLPNAMVFHARRRPELQRAIVGTALVLTSLLGGIAVLLSVALVPLLLSGGSTELVAFASWYACLAPFSMWLFLYRAHLEGGGDFKTFGLQQVSGVALLIPLLLVLWWGDRLDAKTAAAGRAMAIFVIAVPMMVVAWVRLCPTLQTFSARSRELLSYGLRDWVGGAAGLLGNEADKLLILSLLAAADLGRYTVALSVVSLVGLLQAAVTSVLFPTLTGQGAEVVVRRIAAAGALTLTLGACVGGLLWGLAPWLVPFVYGEEFGGLTGLLGCLLVASPLSHMTVGLQAGLRVLGRPGLASSTAVAQHASALALIACLTPGWGLLGAGIGIVIAAVPSYLLTLAIYRFVLGVSTPYPHLTLSDLRQIRARLFSSETSPELAPAAASS